MAAVLPLDSPDLPDACAQPLRGVLRLSALALAGGRTLIDADVAWQAWGDPGLPAVVVLGGISAGRDPDRWWSAQCGAGRALDPRRLRIVSIDWLGGAGGSTGPRAGDAAFPAIDSADQAAAVLAVLNHLGIARVAVAIGASYGGCVVQHLARLAGERIGRAVVISAGPQASAWARGLRGLQRGLVAAAAPEHRAAAVAQARQLAMLSYRTPGELESRFGGAEPAQCLEHWLDAHGARFAARFPADAFVTLSASLDAHRCDPGTIAAPVTVVGVRGDLLVPIETLRAFAERLGPRAELCEFDSIYGHDAFLKEDETIAGIFRHALAAEDCA
ncbi:MAG TPA: alpha/beta fold hydrolase [Dokdonella sp.]|uniref:alpha/beta fold hydrolase n=1 Tax=Dokdonella sp. TaxID=2291710 RepID=UPI002C1A951A|nr:alpha/beta fold hydrolase [Dokdonella sp.]HUD43847.1 alpha/beta fold hydrolase [Dokdonella sp.]